MTDRSEAVIPDNWAEQPSEYTANLVRELLTLVADNQTLDSGVVQAMLSQAWYIGYRTGQDRPEWLDVVQDDPFRRR